MLFTEHDNEQAVLQERAHADLSKRARGGIVIYLLGWLVMTVPVSIHVTHTLFFHVNTLILVCIMLLRAAHIATGFRANFLSVELRQRWLVWSILAGALHWGLMTAWVVAHSEYSDIEYQIVAAAAVLGIAGTAALSIAREIRLLYSPLIMGPLCLALVIRGNTDDLILATMAGRAVTYITFPAKTTSQDYWQAISNEQLAQKRALQMENLSHTDQLTQLSNRSYFDRRFSEEWKRGSRLEKELSILMIDLDHFKSINDEFGHLVGDLCLQRVAGALGNALMRETDLLARYGGEEFVVLLPGSNASGAAIVAERLRAAVQHCEVEHAGDHIRLSCSIGGATMRPAQNKPAEQLLEQADASLYRAKAAGRNCYAAAEMASVIELR